MPRNYTAGKSTLFLPFPIIPVSFGFWGVREECKLTGSVAVSAITFLKEEFFNSLKSHRIIPLSILLPDTSLTHKLHIET